QRRAPQPGDLAGPADQSRQAASCRRTTLLLPQASLLAEEAQILRTGVRRRREQVFDRSGRSRIHRTPLISMCGIAGIVNHVDRVVDGSIERMIDHIHYRGPDGAGAIAFEQDGVALGHRRLSILDVSEAGRQPMSSADGRFWIVYNGEIYNCLEIRQVLEGLGHEFRTGTDTEVLLQAYIRWGAACLDRVMGMYAFAIWDRQEHELFAARD